MGFIFNSTDCDKLYISVVENWHIQLLCTKGKTTLRKNNVKEKQRLGKKTLRKNNGVEKQRHGNTTARNTATSKSTTRKTATRKRMTGKNYDEKKNDWEKQLLGQTVTRKNSD